MVVKSQMLKYISLLLLVKNNLAETNKFRILAPEFICPKDGNTSVDKSQNTVITIQTAANVEFDIEWTVRWTPLQSYSQRSTLMLWKVVRALEVYLNGPQSEPYVYVIDNNKLLPGVDYIFNVTAVEPNGQRGSPKCFHIDYSQGDPKLNMIEGRSDMLSVVLVGGQVTYADTEFVLEAQVTSCYPTQDYYFVWSVRSTKSEHEVNVSHITGSRLEVHPNMLRAGLTYVANCQVVKSSSGLRITQNELPFEVLYRGLELYLNVDFLMVTVNEPFVIETTVRNHDYYEDTVTFKWEVKFEGEVSDIPDSTNNETLVFSTGFPQKGVCMITVTASVLDESATATATIISVEPLLPLLQISSVHRVLNEGTKVSMVANASNVAPTCTLTWYFASEEYLSFGALNDTCEDCQHGEAITDTLTIYSLEENFLNELTDFTNETEWRQVTAQIEASAGRARFVAQCGCSLTFSCETEGMVYADINFKINHSPKARTVMVSPDTGSALETVFRISTLAAVDPDTPLRYSFYCRMGSNDTLLLASFIDHLAVETFLPYIDVGAEVWVEVCDVLGACSAGDAQVVTLAPGEGSSVGGVISDVHGHASRCEPMLLQRLVVMALVTYKNADQQEILNKFSTAVKEALSTINEQCKEMNNELHTSLLNLISSYT